MFPLLKESTCVCNGMHGNLQVLSLGNHLFILYSTIPSTKYVYTFDRQHSVHLVDTDLCV